MKTVESILYAATPEEGEAVLAEALAAMSVGSSQRSTQDEAAPLAPAQQGVTAN
jgi:hypothetical protein